MPEGQKSCKSDRTAHCHIGLISGESSFHLLCSIRMRSNMFFINDFTVKTNHRNATIQFVNILCKNLKKYAV